MSVDDSAISDQQEAVPGADSDVNKHELPGQNGNPSAATESPVSPSSGAPAQSSQPQEGMFTRDPQVGVTDADWHNPNLPVPAPKSQDELMEHLSEALADMASDFAELPALEVPKNFVVNKPATHNAEGGAAQSQPAIPPQPEHPAPSQQIRSSLPPGSVSSQSNPQLILSSQAGNPASRTAANEQNAQSQGAPPPNQGTAQSSTKAQTSRQEQLQSNSADLTQSDATLDTGDHPTLPPQQQYFVMEGVAPPATPPPDVVQHERKIQHEAAAKEDPKDGLQIRRLIATQQGVAAAQSQPNIPALPTQQSQPNIQGPPTQQSQPNIPGQSRDQNQPIAPSRPAPNDPPRAVGTASSNSVQLPPMFGGKPPVPAKSTEPASDRDQQKAHTDLQALPKSPVSKFGNDLRQPTIVERISLEQDLQKPLADADNSSPKSVLTGHNFQPRQADPRSTMSALQAMPAPTPPAPGQPVSQLGAALASSLPSNPPTGQHTVPEALREPAAQSEPTPRSDSKPSAPHNPDDAQPSSTAAQAAPGPTISGVTSAQAQVNPLGPAASRPLPSIDNSGTVRAGAQAPHQQPAPTVSKSGNPLGPAPTANPLGPPGAPLPSPVAHPQHATNPLGPPGAPLTQPTVPQNQQGLPATTGGSNPLGAPPQPLPAQQFGPSPVAKTPGAEDMLERQTGSKIKTVTPTDSDDELEALGTTHYQSAPQENVMEQLYQKPSGIRASISPTKEITGPQPITAPTPPAPTLPAAQKLTDLVPPGAPGHQAPGQRALNKPGTQSQFPPPQGSARQTSSGTAQSGSSQGFSSSQTSLPQQGTSQTSLPQQSATAASSPKVGQQESTAPQAQPLQTSTQTPPQSQTSAPPQTVSPAVPPGQSSPTAPSTTPPAPKLFPSNPNSARAMRNDLREDTGLVLPHSAPEPDPNQRVTEEFGKSTIPGVTPVSKPFETTQGKERREAKEREVEALNRIQLPARSDHPTEAEKAPPPVISRYEEQVRNPPPKEPPKPRRQNDTSRSERFANLLHDAPNSSTSPASGAGKRLRASQSGGGFSDLIKNKGRAAIVALLVVPLVLSVSAVIFITGKSLIKVSMSPSQRAGEEAFNEGNYDRAVNYFNEAIKADDKKAELYHDRARANLRLQKYAAAVADYSSALNLDQNFAGARLDRAAAYYYLGDYTKAIADYDVLIKSDDKNADAYFGRGLSYSKLKQYAPALDDLNKVVQLNPHHTGAFEDIANAYLAQGQLNEAIDAYSRSLKNNAHDANAFYMRANTYKRLGKTSEALNDFTSAIDVAPGRYEFYNDRGYAFYESGKYKEAIVDLAIAMQLNPTYEIAKHNLTAACNKLIASIGPAPKTPEQLGDIAFAYYHSGNYSMALAAANKALLLNAQYRPALNIRAALELKDRRFDYALTDADNALKIKADDKDAMLTRARAYLNMGRYEKAIKDFDSCVSENDNTSLFALRERALAHLLANEGALATTDAQQFLELNGWSNSLSGPTVLLWWLAKRQLQDIDGANAALSQGETRLKATQWPYGVLKFLKREITLTELNNMARNERERTDVRTWLGFDHMLGGLRDEARSDFEWVKKSGYKDNDDYLLAVEQLKNEARN